MSDVEFSPLEQEPWVSLAKCLGTGVGVDRGDNVFTSGKPIDERIARNICLRSCLVFDDCLEYALSNNDTIKGVWAATTGAERHIMIASRDNQTNS